MTFEELLVLIDKMNGEAGFATGGNVDSLVYSGLDVHLMLEEIKSGIEQLQETYAPKIKMASEQKEEFMAFVNSPDDNFENFWFCLGSGDSLYKNKISEDDLMRAWLHPELIEVSDD